MPQPQKPEVTVADIDLFVVIVTVQTLLWDGDESQPVQIAVDAAVIRTTVPCWYTTGEHDPVPVELFTVHVDPPGENVNVYG